MLRFEMKMRKEIFRLVVNLSLSVGDFLFQRSIVILFMPIMQYIAPYIIPSLTLSTRYIIFRFAGRLIFPQNATE